jgi:signal transduction histidine kinase
VFWSTLVFAMVPLVIALLVTGATMLRLRVAHRQTALIKATVGSRWIADRLAHVEEARWAVFLKEADQKLGAPLGLFGADGSPLIPGRLGALPIEDLGGLFARADAGGNLEGGRYVASSAAVGLSGDSPRVVVAVESRLTDEDIWRSIVFKLGIVAYALIPVGFAFGFFFGTVVNGRLERLRQHLLALTTEAQPSPVIYAEPMAGGILEDLGLAATRLEQRFRDELVLYEDAIQEVHFFDEQKTVFLKTLASELRDPLDAIIEHSRELIDGRDGALEESQAEDMEIVQKGAERLLSLVEDVDDLSAIISGGITYDEKPVDLAGVAEEVVKAARWGLGDKVVSVELEVEPGFRPEVAGNRRRLWQVLTNLLSNAIKFTDQGQVRVAIIQVDASRVGIEVSDTGPGIPSSEHTAIFDPFRQHGDRKKRIRGTGLGLAICKRLTELHHGEIEVNSAEGRGSVFTVILPTGR